MMIHTKFFSAPIAALLLLASACSSDDHAEHASTPPAAQAPAAGHSDPAPSASASSPAAASVAEIGKPAPDFTLKDLDGKDHHLSQYRGKIVVLEWISPACPTCQWAYTTGPLVDMPEKLLADGVVWLSINSEAGEHAAASIHDNKAFVDAHHIKAPILLDPTGTVGRSYGAKTTPHMYVIDGKGTLVYKGGLDNAPGGRVSGGGERIDYVGNAVADVKAGRAVKTADTKSYG